MVLCLSVLFLEKLKTGENFLLVVVIGWYTCISLEEYEMQMKKQDS